MGWLDGLRITGTGLEAQRTRLEVVAQNLANADATRTIGPNGTLGGPYRRKEVVLAATPGGAAGGLGSLGASLPGVSALSFASGFGATGFGGLGGAGGSAALDGVRVAAVQDDPGPLRKVYDPGNPDADPQGYVLMPNVNVPVEMADMATASRAYEANAAVLQTLRQSDESSLELLK